MEALKNKVEELTWLISSFMNQMTGLTFPTPFIPEVDQSTHAPIVNLSLLAHSLLQVPTDANLVEGVKSKSWKNETKEKLDP